MIILLKNNLGLFKQERDLNHGRSNKLPIKIIFFFECPLNGIIKQIMTGPPGYRLFICPLRFRIAFPKISVDLGWCDG